MNIVTITGRLGKDPEVRYTTNGTTTATFSLATSRKWTDRKTKEKREKVDWHRVVVFGGTAERVGQYLKKGQLAQVVGSISYDSYVDKENVTRYTAEIRGREVQFLDFPKNSVPPPEVAKPAVDEDEIPF